MHIDPTGSGNSCADLQLARSHFVPELGTANPQALTDLQQKGTPPKRRGAALTQTIQLSFFCC